MKYTAAIILTALTGLTACSAEQNKGPLTIPTNSAIGVTTNLSDRYWISPTNFTGCPEFTYNPFNGLGRYWDSVPECANGTILLINATNGWTQPWELRVNSMDGSMSHAGSNVVVSLKNFAPRMGTDGLELVMNTNWNGNMLTTLSNHYITNYILPSFTIPNPNVDPKYSGLFGPKLMVPNWIEEVYGVVSAQCSYGGSNVTATISSNLVNIRKITGDPVPYVPIQ